MVNLKHPLSAKMLCCLFVGACVVVVWLLERHLSSDHQDPVAKSNNLNKTSRLCPIIEPADRKADSCTSFTRVDKAS